MITVHANSSAKSAKTSRPRAELDYVTPCGSLPPSKKDIGAVKGKSGLTFLSEGMTLLLICHSTVWEAPAIMESTSPLKGEPPKLATICSQSTFCSHPAPLMLLSFDAFLGWSHLKIGKAKILHMRETESPFSIGYPHSEERDQHYLSSEAIIAKPRCWDVGSPPHRVSSFPPTCQPNISTARCSPLLKSRLKECMKARTYIGRDFGEFWGMH